MSRKYNVAVVGVRAVGTQMLRILQERRFPIGSLKVLARRARQLQVDGERYRVEEVSREAFCGVDVAFFAGGDQVEGHFGWPAAEGGAVVIDNGSAYRMFPNVPLVVPEVNPEALRNHQNFIASPNCSTIQLVVALKPIHDAARIKRVVVSSYQAVSGRGLSADGAEPVHQLRVEMEAMLERIRQATGDDQLSPEERMQRVMQAASENAQSVVTDPGLFKYPICSNALPHIDKFLPDGYTNEEHKLMRETRKILGDDTIQISATTVRVPVFNAHSESVNLELHTPLSADEARRILEHAPGVTVVDNPAEGEYPLALSASGTDDVFVGRIRQDRSVPYGLDMWVVADNLRKGAALNTVQIAEKMVEMELL